MLDLDSHGRRQGGPQAAMIRHPFPLLLCPRKGRLPVVLQRMPEPLLHNSAHELATTTGDFSPVKKTRANDNNLITRATHAAEFVARCLLETAASARAARRAGRRSGSGHWRSCLTPASLFVAQRRRREKVGRARKTIALGCELTAQNLYPGAWAAPQLGHDGPAKTAPPPSETPPFARRASSRHKP